MSTFTPETNFDRISLQDVREAFDEQSVNTTTKLKSSKLMTSSLVGTKNDVSKGLLSENKDDIDYSHDPLIQQLPKELRQYVKESKDNPDDLVYVNREGCWKLTHNLLSVLCCCYSICNMVVVKQGQIALTQYGDQQEILGPGRHILLSPYNKLLWVKNETDAVIEHGPIKIIQVKRGQLGYGIDMEHGKPILLAQGRHVIKSNSFVWRQFITLRDPRTKLDQLEIIRVETGNIGYCYRSGNLDILKPGLHLITPPDRFGDFLSTQMTILDLPPSVHDTSDYVPLSIVASVFYRIVDPKKALLRIQNIKKQIMETSTATLAGIIRASSLSDVASRSKPFYQDPKKFKKLEQKEEKLDNISEKLEINVEQIYEEASAPPFFQHVHDEFITTLSDHVLEEWGIEIQNIRIESLKINDPNLQKSISNQAIDVSKQHNRYLMLQKQQAIVTVEAETRKTQNSIDTEAETSTTRELAQAEADSIIIKAKAMKEAKRLQGQGEQEYAKLVESTQLGKELALMKVQSDALKGLKQIAYVPHLPGLLSSGKGVFTMDNKMILPKIDN